MDKVSVIIPVYNCKDYLQQAVESVIAQPYQKIRIILVDDGSTDGSSDLRDKLANQHAGVTALQRFFFDESGDWGWSHTIEKPTKRDFIKHSLIHCHAPCMIRRGAYVWIYCC